MSTSSQQWMFQQLKDGYIHSEEGIWDMVITPIIHFTHCWLDSRHTLYITMRNKQVSVLEQMSSHLVQPVVIFRIPMGPGETFEFKVLFDLRDFLENQF